MEEFGFIFPRCVREAKHDLLWKECYSAIRTSFPTAQIVIIDDNSTLHLVDGEFEKSLVNTTVYYNRAHPGAGELLPYIYLHNERPFKKAVCINDSMFLQPNNTATLRQVIENLTDVTFIWDFESHCDYNDLAEQYTMISLLHPSVSPRIRTIFDRRELWRGCFASTSIITLDFLDRLHREYDFFQIAKVCKTRPHRCGLERIFALCCLDARGSQVPCIHGTIFGAHRPFSYTYEQYAQDKKLKIFPTTFIKVWNSR